MYGDMGSEKQIKNKQLKVSIENEREKRSEQ